MLPNSKYICYPKICWAVRSIDGLGHGGCQGCAGQCCMCMCVSSFDQLCGSVYAHASLRLRCLKASGFIAIADRVGSTSRSTSKGYQAIAPDAHFCCRAAWQPGNNTVRYSLMSPCVPCCTTWLRKFNKADIEKSGVLIWPAQTLDTERAAECRSHCAAGTSFTPAQTAPQLQVFSHDLPRCPICHQAPHSNGHLCTKPNVS